MIKREKIIILVLGLLIFSCLILNWEVSTRQGVNGKVSSIKMPLYMKLMDFMTRSNRHQLLVNKIIENCETDEEKLIALFEWSSKNIRPVPEDFPKVDDHVDNIIIRGYGSKDQAADVFTTLATFAGFRGGMFCSKFHTISIIESGGKLLPFDTYYHFYFRNEKGEIASLEDIRNNINLIKKASKGFKINGKLDYFKAYQNLAPMEKLGWSKADLQMFSKRLTYIIGRLLRLAEPSKVWHGDCYPNEGKDLT